MKLGFRWISSFLLLMLVIAVAACSFNGCGDENNATTVEAAPQNPAPPQTEETPIPTIDEQLSGAACALVDSGFGSRGTVPIQTEAVVSGLEVPWGIAFLPNGDFLVTERPGRVRLVRNGNLQRAPVVTINVGEEGEGGLLGIAAHPQFSTNRKFYVYYTFDKSSGTVNRVERYTLAANGLTASADRVIIDDIPSGTFHNGGRILFGPDGMLYVGTGDARSPSNAQSSGNLAGKILRLTPEGSIPTDNPSNSAVYISGIRNTQGFDWINPKTLLVTDHGPTGELGRSGGDELSVANPGDNLGWPDAWKCGTASGMTAPLLAWNEAAPPGGAALYRGNKIPEWRGSFLIGTLRSKHLHRVVFEKSSTQVKLTKHEVYLLGDSPSGIGRIREVINGPDGYLYVTTSNCDGRGSCTASRDQILRIKPR